MKPNLTYKIISPRQLNYHEISNPPINLLLITNNEKFDCIIQTNFMIIASEIIFKNQSVERKSLVTNVL